MTKGSIAFILAVIVGWLLYDTYLDATAASRPRKLALPDTVVACRGQHRIDSLLARLETKSRALDRKLDGLKKDTSFVKEYIIR